MIIIGEIKGCESKGLREVPEDLIVTVLPPYCLCSVSAFLVLTTGPVRFFFCTF